MTTLRMRLCSVCKVAIPEGAGARCGECRRLWNRGYNAARPAHHQLYATPEWRRLSAEVRASATRCHWCLKPTTRLVADHVAPVDRAPELALERSNLVASCFACNTRRGRNARLPDLAPVGAAVTPPVGAHHTSSGPRAGAVPFRVGPVGASRGRPHLHPSSRSIHMTNQPTQPEKPAPIEDDEEPRPGFWVRLELPEDPAPPVDITARPFMRGSGRRWQPREAIRGLGRPSREGQPHGLAPKLAEFVERTKGDSAA